jgi:GNAT superfamily N-acetyltransferase
MEIAIQKIELPVPGLESLLAEARSEGYSFLDTLSEEWASRENRFDGHGEALCGCQDRGLLVAVGGLNRDAFAGLPEVGRIRRVYVRSAWRNQGIGRTLVAALIAQAEKSFRCVRLRAENAHAARLYESMGFSPITDPHFK